jgi:hypothetical protein
LFTQDSFTASQNESDESEEGTPAMHSSKTGFSRSQQNAKAKASTSHFYSQPHERSDQSLESDDEIITMRVYAKYRDVTGAVKKTDNINLDNIPPCELADTYALFDKNIDLLNIYLDTTFTPEAGRAIVLCLFKTDGLSYDLRCHQLSDIGVPVAEAHFILCLVKAAEHLLGKGKSANWVVDDINKYIVSNFDVLNVYKYISFLSLSGVT